LGACDQRGRSGDGGSQPGGSRIGNDHQVPRERRLQTCSSQFNTKKEEEEEEEEEKERKKERKKEEEKKE